MSKLINKLTIGGDIETFLQNDETQEIISAEGIVLGTKYKPHQFDPDNKYYATSLDCVSAEFNIPPCKTDGEYYLAIQKALRYIKSISPNGFSPKAMACARLEDKYLQTPASTTYGCSPSLNAWTEEEIRPQPDGSNLRVCGSHIHCGYENPKHDINLMIGKSMDLFLGVPSILIEPENERKASGYGCAGNIREQAHGAEYRVLSAFFASSEELIKWCFRNTEKAIEFLNDGKLPFIMNRGEEIQYCINNGDKDLASKLVEEFKLELV